MTKKFTIRILLFLALLAGLNFVIDWAFKSFSAHRWVNLKMDEQFGEYDGTLTWLAMGNSHNCVNTRILDNSFNYGSPGENYIRTYYKLKYILEKTGHKPEYLLLQADISSFGPKISNRYEYNYYWIKYVDYLELARIKNDRDIINYWIEGKFFSYAGNYKDFWLSIVYRIKMKEVNMFRGYREHRDYRNFADVPDRQKVAWDKAQMILTKNEPLDPAIRVYFDMIMQLCREHQVKVLLIRFPEAKEFYEEQERLVPVGKLYEEVTAIAEKYMVFNGILDYHDMFFEHPEYFFDPDHLNVKGSDLFTEKLAEDLKKLTSFRPLEFSSHSGQ
ncbi:MAG TPA: hypothetical protein PLW31_09835 [Bacteroidales bacterium]|nr:hypothetical protein [Bacteroidales bacterium]HPI87135.1 hypothetical protein [Bacteroidales bacterium]HPM91463.1 hypothetical protein [Bacteroidales bacterium]